jgi:hypothetical protein
MIFGIADKINIMIDLIRDEETEVRTEDEPITEDAEFEIIPDDPKQIEYKKDNS